MKPGLGKLKGRVEDERDRKALKVYVKFSQN